MEIIVCILTTLFFAALEIREITARSSGMQRNRIEDEAFMLLPLYSDERPGGEALAEIRPAAPARPR